MQEGRCHSLSFCDTASEEAVVFPKTWVGLCDAFRAMHDGWTCGMSGHDRSHHCYAMVIGGVDLAARELFHSFDQKVVAFDRCTPAHGVDCGANRGKTIGLLESEAARIAKAARARNGCGDRSQRWYEVGDSAYV